jgi:hypothetical protein
MPNLVIPGPTRFARVLPVMIAIFLVRFSAIVLAQIPSVISVMPLQLENVHEGAGSSLYKWSELSHVQA